MSSDPNEQQQQLQESFLQQQEKISALKELVRKSGAAHGSSKSAAQEKVKNIAERLLKSKAKSRQGLNVSTYSTEPSSTDASFVAHDHSNMLSTSQGQFSSQSPNPNFASTPNPTPSKPQNTMRKNDSTPSFTSQYSTPGSEKIAIMRQQLEQNKLRMAQKASSKQHLEQLVTQLKEKFDTTQQCLEDTTELGRSMSDLSNLIQYTPVSRERHKSATDLTSKNFNLEKERIKFLENRCRLLEKQLDKEKENNQRNASANVSSASSDHLEAKVSEMEMMLQEKQREFEEKEKDFREEIRKFQNSREITDFECSEENTKLLKENEELKLQIEKLLQQSNTTNLEQEIEKLNKENSQLKQDLETANKQLEIFSSADNETSPTLMENSKLQQEIEELKRQLEIFTAKESNDTMDLLNENQLLKQETETQLKRIKELNEINDVLETTRCDSTSKCTELEEQIKHLQADVIVAQEKQRLAEDNNKTNSSSTANMSQQTTDSLVKSEMAKQIQELMDEIQEIRSENSKLKATLNEQEKLEINDSSIADKIANLEACIESQREDLLKTQELRNKFEEELMEKTIELNVLNANFKVLEEKLESTNTKKPLFSSATNSPEDVNNPELELENQQLKQKLDESNKAMIKLKLKSKQTEKQIEKLKKSSDLHGEVVKLTKEKEQLQQKITELEDEKGQWQLTQMETSQGSNNSSSNKEDEAEHQKYQEKIETLENIIKEKETLLETLQQGEQSRVTSELGEIQLEEQVKELTEELSTLRLNFQDKDKSLQDALATVENLNKQKDDLDKKLEHYLSENIELLDKVEKLSKSSSSAESIEMVERLTQQEKQELEEFNKRLGETAEENQCQKEAVNELTQTEMNPEITESLNKLREESSELQTKIELFTTERREVLEKMEHLNTENHELLQRIEDLTLEKQEMEKKLNKQQEEQEQLENKLGVARKEKEALSTQMQEFKAQRNQLSHDMSSLQQSSEVVAALENSETLFEKCETSLTKLHGELEAYRKANDKKSKFNVSKKLAKEAENAYTQLTELLQKVKESSSAVETVTVVETVVAVTASNGKALAEYEQLTAQNRELKATILELRRQLEEARDLTEDQTDTKYTTEEPPQAITIHEDTDKDTKLQEALQQNQQYQLQVTELQSQVEDLAQELSETRTGLTEKSEEITKLSQELSTVKDQAIGGDEEHKENDKKLQDALQQNQQYELQLTELQSHVEDLAQELYETRTGLTEKSEEITKLSQELSTLKELSDNFDHLLNDKEMAYEKQVEQLTRLRKELESKCDTYEQEMEILQTLVNEQKQQLIEAYKEHEHEMNIKLLELQQHEQQAQELKHELVQIKQTASLQGSELTQDLQQDLEKLKEMLKIQKNLVQQQVEELSNKQDTIDTLNQQIIDLYKTMEENANKIIEKEDEITYLQELYDSNKQELEKLEQNYKQSLDKNQKLEQLNKEQKEIINQQLEKLTSAHKWEQKSVELEQRNKDQLEKLKKYAANLKKKVQQCVEFENKLKIFETNDKSHEIEDLTKKNSQLQENLQQKCQELEDATKERSILQQSIIQLQQEVSDKQTALDLTLQQQQQTSDWGDSTTELETLQDELFTLREEMRIKDQKIVELQQIVEQQENQLKEFNKLKEELQVSQSFVQQLQHDLLQTQQQTSDWGDSLETEQLRQELQAAHVNMEKLQSDLVVAQQQSSSDWGNSSEIEQLRLELQNSQISIHKLQNDLLQAQQQSSDWGDSNETTQLRQKLENVQKTIEKLEAEQQLSSDWGDSNETEQLREELQCTQENFKLKVQEIEELRQSLMAAQEQLTDWGNESTGKKADYENLTKVLADKTEKLEKAETQLDELENEVIRLKEKDYENSQKIQELTKELQNLSTVSTTTNPELELMGQKLIEVTEELKAKALKFEKSKAVIKERNGQIHRLQAQLKDLQEKLTCCPEEEILSPTTQHQLDASIQQPIKAELESLKEAYAKLNDKYSSEKANFHETTNRLETLHDGIQAKLQEDMAYIETLEQENNQFKSKICRLEECVGSFEERRASMERKVNFMDAQLQSNTEEHTKTEDELIYRLNMLSNHDEVIAQRLLDSQSEKEELEQKYQQLETEYQRAVEEHKKLETLFESKAETTTDYEQELAAVKEQLTKTEADMERQKAVYDGKLAAKATEFDELEYEMSDQLQTINAEKRQLAEQLDKSREESYSHQNDILRLQENLNTLEQAKSELERESSWLRMQTENSQQDLYELQELRMQSMQDKTEIDNLKHQIDTLSNNHESELQALRTQIAELDTLRMQVGQNQTDDQVFIETENKRLTDLLAEKEAIIENYQRQNLQLQMAAASTTASSTTQANNQADPFALAFGLPSQNPSNQLQAGSAMANNPSDPFALAFGLPPQNNPSNQLQMTAPPAAAAATSTSSNNSSDPFALAFGLPPQQNASHHQLSADNANYDLERLNQDLQEKNNQIYRLQQDLNNLQAEFNVVLEGNQEMQRQLADQQQNVVNLQTLQSVANTLNDNPANDLIPAPPMFFNTEAAAVRTPFDDIIQPHSLEPTLSSPSHNDNQEQSPTIEDLQRNVSDLEKHAQDLEHKLASRNQREAEYDDRLRELETRYQEREQQLQFTQMELQKLQTEYVNLQQQQIAYHNLQQQQTEVHILQQQLEDLKIQLRILEGIVQERDQELEHIKRERKDEEHLKKTMSSLENQIVPAALDASIQPTLDMFFGNSTPGEFEVFSLPQQSTEPVVEEIIVPKKTYLCQPKETDATPAQETNITALELGEDWGDSWGNNEAVAEAEHFATTTAAAHTTSLVPREQQLELQMQELQERLQELQLSLERSEEQKKELHVKSGKLMKKLKEYKVKIDELQCNSMSNKDYRKSASIESNSMFGDLDAAIQEELKNQIKSLEHQLEEQKKQQDTHSAEKDKLLKRIDMLTAGNERMSDMKERQDMEVQMYQVRIKELQDKLNNLDDWGNEEQEEKITKETQKIPSQQQEPSTGFSNNSQELQNQIATLTLEIQDLTGDRLELQALLEEEKLNSTKAEESVAALRLQLQTLQENQTSERSSDIYQTNQLKLDLQNLQESYNNLLTTKEKLTFELKSQSGTLNLSQTNEKRLQMEVDVLKTEVETLRETLNNTKQSLIDLGSELSILKEQKEKQIDEASLELIISQKQSLEEQAQKLLTENENLKLTQANQLNTEELEERLQSLLSENEYLKNAASATDPTSNNNEELTALLQEKESEILHLKQRINDLMNEDQTEKLVLEILTKNQEIHMLKMQVKHLEDDKHELENNLSLQITKEMQANKEDQQTNQNSPDQAKQQMEFQIKELLAEKKQMEEELQVLNNHVLESLQLEDKLKSLTLELDTKNIENLELRKTVEAIKSTGGAVTVGNRPEPALDYNALNTQWEAIVEQRCGEIAKMWQEHLAQRERDFKNNEERLQQEINNLRNTSNISIEKVPQVLSVETTSSSTPASESTTASGTTSAEASQDGTPLRIRADDTDAHTDAILEKMQAALESQEMEIVTLKEQLAIRSAEYARLAAQYDPFKLHNTSSHSTVTSPSEARKISSSSDIPMVAKAELDLAMYMLHQRDMRCEEMTLELVNLLEERDTLQLKLSNTLRQVEAIKTQSAGGFAEASSLAGAASTSSTSENILNTSVAGSTAGNSDDDLNQKLSQLQTVSHSKDKIIKEEREQRSRQMEMLQQDVAKIPPAAVSELLGNDLSQSNQSPSTVLLNWLWGNKGGNNGGPQPGF